MGGQNTIAPDALFFIAEYGGFNTDSLDKSNSEPATFQQSGVYFEKVLMPAFNNRPDKTIKLDDWLRQQRENYKAYIALP